MAKIQEAKGPFVWKDSYVYAADLDGKCWRTLWLPGWLGSL